MFNSEPILDKDSCRKFNYKVFYLCCLKDEEKPEEEIVFTVNLTTDSCNIGDYGEYYGQYIMDCELMKKQPENDLMHIKQSGNRDAFWKTLLYRIVYSYMIIRTITNIMWTINIFQMIMINMFRMIMIDTILMVMISDVQYLP